MRVFAILAMCVGAACAGEESAEPVKACGTDGQSVEAIGANVCAYELAVVIEEGFECPADFSYRLETQGGSICSDVRITLDELPTLFCAEDFNCEPEPELGQTCGGNAPNPMTCSERLRCCQPDSRLLDAPGSCRQPADDALVGEPCGVDANRCCGPGLACESDASGNGTCV